MPKFKAKKGDFAKIWQKPPDGNQPLRLCRQCYVAIANDSSSLIPKPDSQFTSSKSNCAFLNKWHVISVTWSNGENLSNCWSNGEKLVTFTTGNIKGSDHCYIGDLGKIPGWSKTHLTGCVGEIIGFHRILKDDEIHEYLMKKWGIKD